MLCNMCVAVQHICFHVIAFHVVMCRHKGNIALLSKIYGKWVF